MRGKNICCFMLLFCDIYVQIFIYILPKSKPQCIWYWTVKSYLYVCIHIYADICVCEYMFVSHITYVYMYVCIFRSVYLLVLLEENNIIQPWDLIWESHLLISTFINFLTHSSMHQVPRSLWKIRIKKSVKSYNNTRRPPSCFWSQS